jgi:hypothetical protein
MQYIQYRAILSTSDTAHTPVLHRVEIEYITSALYEPSCYLESSVYDAGSSIRWQTVSWDAETPVLVGENKPADTEPDPMVDCSPLIGENLSPFENAQARDGVYENIAEIERAPWWDRSWMYRCPVTINNEGNPSALEDYQIKIEVEYAENMCQNFDDLRFIENENQIIVGKWWDEDWGYKKKIIIDHTKVDADLDNFPVLINLSDPDLSKAMGNGDDIVFTDGAETTKLDHEIESFDGTNLVAWIKIPSLFALKDTTIYMYYGNPGAPNQENPAGVWDGNYVGVYHMIDDTTSSIADSTNFNNDGTKKGANEPAETTEAQIFRAENFDGSDDYIKIYGITEDNDVTSSQGTVELWMRREFANTDSGRNPVFQTTDNAKQNSITFRYNPATNQWKFSYEGNDSFSSGGLFAANAIPENTWVHVWFYWTIGASNDAKLYVNLTQKANITPSNPSDNWDNAVLGIQTNLVNAYNGQLDEIRISNVVRSTGWVSTSYNNQNLPLTFYSVGTEEPYSDWGDVIENVGELSYWIENYNLGENAVVWVKVPNIPADNNKMIYMYYGSPCARPASDFHATFPKALIIDGTCKEEGGPQERGWVEIKNGGILVVQGEKILELFARNIIVDSDSYIYATGSGYSGGDTNRLRGEQENGASHDPPGTGGGTGGYALEDSNGPGGGGGAYGGLGGDGGGAQGDNDHPGLGGENFGNATDNIIYMGSGGGSGGLAQGAPQNNSWNAGGAGGSGGGGIRLNASIIIISENVYADGGDGAGGMGTSSYGNGGGGGGSGGTILIEGNEVTITGELSAKGGTGGRRSPNTGRGGAGGGGGGGRIKVFYGESFDNGGMTYPYAGGASGGSSYEAPDAEPGESGTYYVGTISYLEPTATINWDENEYQPEAEGPLGYYLNWEHRVENVELGYENYTFRIWGYASNDEENIGVYIWQPGARDWFFIDNLPDEPKDDPIIFNIPPENLTDYLFEDNLSIGYFDNGGDSTRTFIHIDYCVLECVGEFSTEVKVYTRTGDTDNAYDGSWSDWEEATNEDEIPSPDSRYLQYQVELRRAELCGKITPVFKEIILNYLWTTAYGTAGFGATNLFYPDQAYVYEGGTVILIQDRVDLMLSRPTIITVSETEDQDLIRVDANFWMIENKNKRTSAASTGIGTIELFCRDSTYTAVPVDGPNCENLTLKISSPYQNAWRGYLRDLREELIAMDIEVDLNEDALILTITGRDDTPGVKDIYYYEKVTEIEVTVR